MIALASRLTAGSGREALVRLVLTAAGIALAVTMLLVAAVAFPALHAHDVRRAWTETSDQNQRPAQDEDTTDPLLWRLTNVRFDGRDLVRVDLAPEGPDAPVPPGLERLPGPGEIAVSPRLAELLDTTDPAMLADRFDGRVTATVGPAALASPDDLVAFVGHAADELRAEADVSTVRSIESSPISRNLTRSMRVVFVVGGVGLLAPVVVFVATATRLAAARREQRLAALRLAGATTGQVGVVAAVEAAIAALAGTMAGFGLFFAIRPGLARIPLDGAAFYPSDLDLSPGWAAAIALAVPALAMTAAVISLRRIRISPLGVARRAVPPKPTPRPLLLVATGMAGVALTVVSDRRTRHGEIAVAYAIGAAFLVMIVGIVLSGPWLTSVVGRGIARVGRRAPSLLAARRLQENPAAGFRAISGIIVAVFVGTVFSGIAASILANNDPQDAGLAADVVAAVPRVDPVPLTPGIDPQKAPPPPPTEVGPDVVAELEDDLAAVPGVDQVVTAHAVPDDPELRGALARTSAGLDPTTMLISCPDAATLGFDRCEGTTTVNASGYRVTADGVSTPLSVAEVEALPVTAMAAATDGSSETVEQVRTILERGLPGAGGVTRADLEAESQQELRTEERVSNIGIAVTLVIAGCSVAVAVAGAIVERRRSFAQLRLAGTRLSDLRRVVMAEAAAPLLMVAGASVALGLAVARLVLAASGGGQPFVVPGAGYWLALAGGLALALLVVLGTLPLLTRLTALDSARFE
jgi:hypothetical protein